jgi:hypothetical protein
MLQYSDDVRRKAAMEDVSKFATRVERIPSSRQRRRNIGLAEAIICAYRSRKELGLDGRDIQQWVERKRIVEGRRSIE